MTGPLGPLNDDGVVDLLHAAARGGPDPTPADVARAMTAGRKIRRRRQTMQVVGSGVAAVAVVAAGVAVVGGLNNDPGRTTVASKPDDVKPTPYANPAPTSATQQRLANLQLLASALGPDFRVNPKGREAGEVGDAAYPVVDVVPGSPTAQRVPVGYAMTAVGRVQPNLATSCKPMVEKGTHRAACTAVTTPGGQTVQLQKEWTVLGEYPVNAKRDGDALTAYFVRTDGSMVVAHVNAVSQSGTTPTTATNTQAKNLVDSFGQALADFVADDAVLPQAGAPAATGTQPAAPSQNDLNQGYLQQALGSSFSLFGGEVVLEINSPKYRELPSDYFSGTAALTKLTQAQFDAACGARPGFAGCQESAQPDGSRVYTNRWADRDATNDTLRGESAAYWVRNDGTIVLATISLSETHVTAANRDVQVNGTLAWFDSLKDALVKAATDPRMTFES